MPHPAPALPAPSPDPPLIWLFKQLGEGAKNAVGSVFEDAMRAVWDASVSMLQAGFTLVDKVSVFTVDIHSGPIGILWPISLWISGLLATGLFFWQLMISVLRGGRGFLRLVTGPFQYGVMLAVIVGIVAAMLAAMDGLTTGILNYGLHADNFTDALKVTSIGDAADDGVKAVVLGICGMVGVIPAAIGYGLEMIFREAAIDVMVAAAPITAAGLLAGATSAWAWTTARWIAVALTMKPVLAFEMVFGVGIVGGAKGLTGLLAGVLVLLMSLLAPFALFRLFAFVDPNTDPGRAFRDSLASYGVDSYGRNNPAILAGSALRGAGGSGADAIEDANTSRFDNNAGDKADADTDAAPSPQSTDEDPPDAEGTDDGADSGGTSGGASRGGLTARGPRGGGSRRGFPGGQGDRAAPVPPPDSGPEAGPESGDDDGGEPGSGGSAPQPPGPRGGGPHGGGGAAAGAEEAAVVL